MSFGKCKTCGQDFVPFGDLADCEVTCGCTVTTLPDGRKVRGPLRFPMPLTDLKVTGPGISMGSLTKEQAALWDKVTASIQELADELGLSPKEVIRQAKERMAKRVKCSKYGGMDMDAQHQGRLRLRAIRARLGVACRTSS